MSDETPAEAAAGGGGAFHNGMAGTEHALIPDWVADQLENKGSEATYNFLRGNGWNKNDLGGGNNKWCKDCNEGSGGLMWVRMCNAQDWTGDQQATADWAPYLNIAPTADNPQNAGSAWGSGFWAQKHDKLTDGQSVDPSQNRWRYRPKYEIVVSNFHPETGEDLSQLADGQANYGPTGGPAGYLDEHELQFGTAGAFYDGTGDSYNTFHQVNDCDDICPDDDTEAWGCTSPSYDGT